MLNSLAEKSQGFLAQRGLTIREMWVTHELIDDTDQKHPNAVGAGGT